MLSLIDCTSSVTPSPVDGLVPQGMKQKWPLFVSLPVGFCTHDVYDTTLALERLVIRLPSLDGHRMEAPPLA